MRNTAENNSSCRIYERYAESPVDNQRQGAAYKFAETRLLRKGEDGSTDVL